MVRIGAARRLIQYNRSRVSAGTSCIFWRDRNPVPAMATRLSVSRLHWEQETVHETEEGAKEGTGRTCWPRELPFKT